MPDTTQLPTIINARATVTALQTQSAFSAASGRNAQAASAGSTASVDYDTFLKLLVAQLKNQDPTDPTDATEYVAQLATFSNVEQAVSTNKKLDELLASIALTQADSILGRTVTSADGSVSGEVSALRIEQDGTVAILEGGGELRLGAGVEIS